MLSFGVKLCLLIYARLIKLQKSISYPLVILRTIQSPTLYQAAVNLVMWRCLLLVAVLITVY